LNVFRVHTDKTIEMSSQLRPFKPPKETTRPETLYITFRKIQRNVSAIF
jgi:hypothetical protein